MKNNIKNLMLLVLFFLGSITIYSCSNSSTQSEAEVPAEDSTVISEVVVEEVVETAASEMNWASELKQWVVNGEGTKSISLDKISGEGEISEEGRIQLDLVAAILETNPTIKGEIQGHSANKGKPAQEKIGSAARAEWTRLKLIVDHDAVAKNVSAKGYGSEMPIEGLDPADEKQKRITIRFSK